MPAGIEVQAVTYRYDHAADPILSRVDLLVHAGEFVTLLGPSGSGKTTLLKIVAGLVSPAEGSVLLSGRDVTSTAVHKRNVGFVFQNYSLFPHLTVRDNIMYPLRVRRVSPRDADLRAGGIIEAVGLGAVSNSYPGQLSGGQQQRVALARALVFEPDVLLLDEPLGALDRNLRERLVAELRAIHARLGFTALYVTHDRFEAMTLSSRVAVMQSGAIVQIAPPEDVYRSPTDPEVAQLVGDANVFKVRSVAAGKEGGKALVISDELRVDLTRSESAALQGIDPVSFGVRPEDISFELYPREAAICWRGRVAQTSFLGVTTRCSIDVGGGVTIIVEGVGRNLDLVREGSSGWVVGQRETLMVW